MVRSPACFKLNVYCGFRVGIAPATVEVRFQDLHIEAKVFVGARALPSVLNSYRNFFEVSLATASFSFDHYLVTTAD